mgnify:CR=1 FL=1|tara:strand:- start:804 stop:1040 length:237 start_codon:yes stop_codon:yes gene_type:complete
MKKFLLYLLVFNTGFASAVFLARSKPEYFVPDVMLALNQAISEVQKGCPLLFDYAVMLEKENANLNRVLRTMTFEKKE